LKEFVEKFHGEGEEGKRGVLLRKDLIDLGNEALFVDS